MPDLEDLLADFARELEESDRDFVVPTEAARFVEDLPPSVLEEWLRTRAIALVGTRLAKVLNSDRAKALHRARARDFEAGDWKFFDRAQYVVSENNVRKNLGRMTAPDLMFAAAAYDSEGRHAFLEAAFLRVLASRVGGQTVGEAMTEDEAAKLRRSVLGDEPTDSML